MSEVAPGGEFPESFNENDIFLERPTLIERANEMARYAENDLNAFEGSPGEREALAGYFIMPKLNELSGIMGRLIIVNDRIRRHHIEPTTLDRNGMATVTPIDYDAEDLQLQSLGYRAGIAPEGSGKHVVIKHFGIERSYPISDPSLLAIILQADQIEIPIDDGVRIKVIDEVMPPHIELLQRSMPKLMDRIGAALGKEGSLNNKLHRLSHIDLREYTVLHDKGSNELRHELIYYINQNLSHYFDKLYHITGYDLQFVVPEKKRGGVHEWLDIVGKVNAISFSTLDPTRLALTTTMHVHGEGNLYIVYDLDEKLGVIPEELRFDSFPDIVSE